MGMHVFQNVQIIYQNRMINASKMPQTFLCFFVYQPLNCMYTVSYNYTASILYCLSTSYCRSPKQETTQSSLVQRSGRNSRSWSFSNINEEYENIYNPKFPVFRTKFSLNSYTVCNKLIGKPNIR